MTMKQALKKLVPYIWVWVIFFICDWLLVFRAIGKIVTDQPASKVDTVIEYIFLPLLILMLQIPMGNITAQLAGPIWFLIITLNSLIYPCLIYGINRYIGIFRKRKSS